MAAFADGLPMVTESTLSIYGDLEEEAQYKLQEFADNPACAGVTIRPVMLTNGDGLVDAVTKQPTDLIVLSSKGSSGLTEWLIGSNAEIIVRNAHCPVLVIKEPVAEFNPRHIVYAVDIDDRLNVLHLYPFPRAENGVHQFLYVMTPTDNRDTDGIREWVNDMAAANTIGSYSACQERT